MAAEGVADLVPLGDVPEVRARAGGRDDPLGEGRDGDRLLAPDVDDPPLWRPVASVAMASATSSTNENARVCCPSPKIVRGSPARAFRMKIATTLRYGSARFWRGRRRCAAG
jgi:hypothetical protein